MALAYWRLETQDLKKYNVKKQPTKQKKMLLYPTHKLFDDHTYDPEQKDNYRKKILTLKK